MSSNPKNVFLISDTHFGHKKLIEAEGKTGFGYRPFSSIEEHDEALIENWNKVVRPDDKVIHLGDFALSVTPEYMESVLKRLNGLDTILPGNHCTNARVKIFAQYFKHINSYCVLGNETILCSHIPVHPRELNRFKVNVHGHLHKDLVENEDGFPDPRYFSVCVEHINYTPIHIDDVRKELKARGVL